MSASSNFCFGKGHTRHTPHPLDSVVAMVSMPPGVARRLRRLGRRQRFERGPQVGREGVLLVAVLGGRERRRRPLRPRTLTLCSLLQLLLHPPHVLLVLLRLWCPHTHTRVCQQPPATYVSVGAKLPRVGWERKGKVLAKGVNRGKPLPVVNGEPNRARPRGRVGW